MPTKETKTLPSGTDAVSLQPNCIVGIGASAGGLEALQEFLTFLPSNTGMAFVIIQHLAPDHKSMLADILSKYSAMPVTEIRDGMTLERNHVYMIPPKYNVELENDVMRLREYDIALINHPIDIFFRSLAAAYENRSVAVILSGTGSDGANGIRSIKERNGVIIVQSPESAKFDGMPRNAIATGFADMIQKPETIAKEMIHIAGSISDSNTHFLPTDEDMLSQVFSILKAVTNINYTYYKQTTILRRIERRMVITHSRNLKQYVNFLGNNPDEAKVLAKEVLIGVTAFFRDSDYFDVLKESVVKQILKNADHDKQIRVWVAGCSTGEEAYSVAILFAESMEELGIHQDIKIFATDLDNDSIATAVRGVYGDNIIEDVSVYRLSKYFTRKGNRYVIRHDIRKMIIFAQHNVFQDPPFGRLDLICCRNVLIYFQSVLQRNLFSIFHMALNNNGYLFLGRSESVMDYDDIFKSLCAVEKIFIHNAGGKVPSHEKFNCSMQNFMSPIESLQIPSYEDDKDVPYKPTELDTSVLEALMPACVLVNEKNELVRSFGDCSQFLSIPSGMATLDIFMLIRNDLKIAVSTALRDSKDKDTRICYDSVPVQFNDKPEYISIITQPILDKHGLKTGHTAIAFIRENRKLTGDIQEYQIDTAASRRISDLEYELKVTKDDLRQTVTELESVNAELQAANEELLTANEELQSSNEELQSVNEELYTVNSEYQSKVNELAGLNDDMANFLSTTLIGILMVDRDLNIRKFTDYISTEFNVADQDIGRSFRYITYNFTTVDLLKQCKQVLESMEPIEQHCASVAGKTYLIRIAPYRVQENSSGNHPVEGRPAKKEVQGLVLTFVDTSKQVDDQEQIEEMARALRLAVKSGQEKETFLSNMSHDMRTPMTAIHGLTELTLKEYDLSPEARDNLEKIRTSSNYMLKLIEEILETSRINAGKVVTVNSTVKENQVIDTLQAVIHEQAESHGLTFDIQLNGLENRYVLMDVPHVERSLMNILSNSIKFTPKGGKILLKVDVAYHDGRADHTYTITDNGVGIPEEFQKRMFQAFEQGNHSVEAAPSPAEDMIGAQEGTGLGLFICKNLVELMGGTIKCISRVGEGTTFTVALSYSLATDEQIKLLADRKDTYKDNILSDKNVLLIEDNHIHAELIIKLLSSKGIHVEHAHNGQEALDLFHSNGSYHYQAIITDLMMPKLDGEGLARRIRELQNTDAKTIPIIALTADVTENVDERCRQAGMNACISKPVDPDRLFALLSKEFEGETERWGI